MSLRRLSCALLAVTVLLIGVPTAASGQAYNPITPTKANETVTLTGDDLTIEEVVDIARHGAQVELGDEALERSRQAYELVLEGARQGIPIYGFNRGSGAGREQVIFEGDPLSDENREFLLQRNFDGWRAYFDRGVGPEVADEEIVRAVMAVMINQFIGEAVTPAVPRLLVGFLNERIAPVINSRGSPGEGDLPMVQGNIRAALIGEGEAHHHGRRMSAREALARAGLSPLRPAVDSLGVYTAWPYNAYTDGQTALLVHDIKEMLDWGDLTYAMAMIGLNSSVTPLTAVPQEVRPFPYHNWQARRLLNLLRGSYLFEFEGLEEENRIIQDPLSFRDYNHRNGAVWQAYDQLRSDLLIELNVSHRNPSVKPGAKPSDSWELDTPWVRRYYVEPGATEGGFILSSANFNETTRDNDLQAFVMALAESIAGTTQRVLRFEDPFFTVIEPSAVLSEQELAWAAPRGQGYTISDLMAELQALANPVPAQGNPIQRQVEDMQSFGRQKVERARLAVNAALHLIGQELLSATYWMNVREAQDPERSFGEAPTAAWQAFRAVIPWQMDPDERPVATPGNLAYAFMRGNPAAQFMGEFAAGPDVRDADADEPEDVVEPEVPGEEEVRDNTDDAVREEGAPERNLQDEVRRLRRRANQVEREIRELRRQARRRGGQHTAGVAGHSRQRGNHDRQGLGADRGAGASSAGRKR